MLRSCAAYILTANLRQRCWSARKIISPNKNLGLARNYFKAQSTADTQNQATRGTLQTDIFPYFSCPIIKVNGHLIAIGNGATH